MALANVVCLAQVLKLKRAVAEYVLALCLLSPCVHHGSLLDACTWVPQGLFEIAARTYRSRASVAASLDGDLDDDGDTGESLWEMAADDDDSFELAATGSSIQLRQGGQHLASTTKPHGRLHLAMARSHVHFW